MIDREHALPVNRQVRLVGISRSSAYYQPRPVSESDLRTMRRIDELHLEFPSAGARMLVRFVETGKYPRRTQACAYVDDADGHRGAVLQTEYESAQCET